MPTTMSAGKSSAVICPAVPLATKGESAVKLFSHTSQLSDEMSMAELEDMLS